MKPSRPATLALALAAAFPACSRPAATTTGDAAAPVPAALATPKIVPATPAPSASAAPRTAKAAAKAGQRVSIASSTFHAGSLPGDEGRDPKLEPPWVEVALGPYEIDALPYPNDPGLPARTDVARDDAVRLCTERGERLCTELEWELACKGTADDVFAAGDRWDPACAREPSSCVSSLGVRAMGAMREWTASDVTPYEKDDRARPAVRGASSDGIDHRCAARAPEDRGAHAGDLGFRCCAGTPNAAQIAIPKPGVAVRKVSLESKALDAMLAAVPQLARLKTPAHLFTEPDDTATVHKKGERADLDGFVLTEGPLLWNPVAGDELLVVAGRAKKDSFVAAFWRLPGDRYRIASSMIFDDDAGPVALAYHPGLREKLLWSTCWKCPMEGGAIVLREGKRVVVVQQ